MSEQIKDNSQHKGAGYKTPFKEGESNPGFATPLFLGSLKEQHDAIMQTAIIFVQLRQMKMDKEQGKGVPDQILNSLEVKYAELKEKHFQNVDQEELEETLANYFTFIQRGERTLRRDDNLDLLDPERFSNQIQRDNTVMSLIEPVPVKNNRNKTSIRDRMRRSLLKASSSADEFIIVLMNSRILLRVKVPTPWELASLINKISVSLQRTQFGGRIRISSLHLERALIIRTIMDWVLSRCTYWSVSDIVESEELLTVIKREDADIIATSILAIGAPKGISYRLTCLADKCQYSRNILVDAAELAVFDDIRYPEAYMVQMLETINTGKKYTREELLSSTVPYRDVDLSDIDARVVSHDGGIVLEIDSPYLSEYFMCFDRAAELINKEIRELAAQFPNANEFGEKRKELIGSMRMIDYLQYFKSMTNKADPLNPDEKDEIILRSEDPGEFNQGLIDMFNEDEEFYTLALTKVLKLVPRFSYTFIGIPDDECPKCKERHPQKEIRNGFTPIDPILNFFDQARMLIAIRREIGALQEEILS
ncbi:hypothetical protein [Aeromonas phage AerS_266]|nr:hypothetical protein [Aeromonas phage AerS_266]